VVDAMNFRVQVFIAAEGSSTRWASRDGEDMGASSGERDRVRQRRALIVVDGAWSRVQVFDQQGELLYYFGQRRTAGSVQPACGDVIDHNDSVYIADSYNSRVQEFQYYGNGAGRGQ